MRFLKDTIRFIIGSKLLISAGGAGMVLTAALLLAPEHTTVPLALLTAVGSATFLVYNLGYVIYGLTKVETRRAVFFSKRARYLYPMLLLALICLLWSCFYLPLRANLMLLVLGLVSLLYNLPDKGRRPSYSLRSLPLLKIFLIAGTWAFIGSFLPGAVLAVKGVGVAKLFVMQFMFILSITLPFDIRDLERDSVRGLLTIPGLFGSRLAVWLALFFCAVYGLLLGLWFSETVRVMAFHALLTAVLLLWAFKKQPYWYYTGLLDGLIILQWVMLILFL